MDDCRGGKIITGENDQRRRTDFLRHRRLSHNDHQEFCPPGNGSHRLSLVETIVACSRTSHFCPLPASHRLSWVKTIVAGSQIVSPGLETSSRTDFLRHRRLSRIGAGSYARA